MVEHGEMRSLTILLCLIAGPLFAGESAILSNGSRLHADRHETDGSKVRLYSGTGYIEMETALVQGFEADPELPASVSRPPAAAIPPPPAQSAAEPKLSPGQLADAAADKYGLPRQLVRSVIRIESGFQPNAISPKGAIGLMQLMPGTAQSLGADPRDPVQNVDAGARYLRQLLEKYDGYLWHALAAYNAGPGAVEKYKGVPPYQETIRYVKKIDEDLKRSQ
jgi:soluble lytic murein transglycosylase-like protein